MTAKPTFFRPTWAALATAVLLAACGGGDAGTPNGSIEDTTPPTVAITDNVSATNATGAITFTFTFSEAVTGFTADDIVVTGGTKGAFSMASNNLSATLVVTPAANSTGTVQVNVVANAFTDFADNANANGANASQAFDTTTPPSPVSSAYLSFDENPSIATAMGAYGGALPEVTAGPSGGSANALKIAKPAGQGNETWGGAYFTVPRVPFTSTQKAITARVYSTVANAVIRLKVEVSGGASVEVAGTTVTQANTWTTVTWNFSAADLAANYTVLAVTPDVNRALDGAVYYIDEINVVDTPAPTSLAFASNYTESPTPWRTTEGGDVGRYAADGALDWWSGLASSDATPNFYFGYGLLPTDWGFGAFVNAPGNGTANVSGYSNVQLAVWGNDQLVNQNPRPNFNLIMQAPAVAGGCIPEVQREFQVTGAGVQTYTIALSSLVVRQDCAQPSLNTAAAILATGVKSVHVQVTTANLNKTLSVDPANGRYPNGLNVGAISFN